MKTEAGKHLEQGSAILESDLEHFHIHYPLSGAFP